MSSRSSPIWFDSPHGRLFAWHVGPDGGDARATAVLCGALGSDEASECREAYGRLAAMLVERGVAAIRFDYHGTGDSAGSWSDPGRVAAWGDSVAAACRLANESGSSTTFLVGMRLGAVLAAREAGRLEPATAGLVLWDPCPTGRAYLRQQMMLASAHGAQQPEDGSIAGLAYTFSPETAEDLRRLSLTEVLGAERQPVLMLARASAPMREVVGRLEGLDGATYREVADAPERSNTSLLCATDEEHVEVVADWIAAHAPARRERLILPTAMAHPSLTIADPQDATRFVIETPVYMGPNHLFGIETKPADVDTGSATVAFVSAGLLEHWGPGRLWTELSRSWAEAGVRCVRVDLSGIGDSGTRPGQARRVVRPPEAIDDLADVATGLGAPDGENLVFVGLSSGAYHAIEAGLRLHPAAVISVNGDLSGNLPDLRMGGRVDHRRAAYRGLPRLLQRLAVDHKRVAHSIWRGVTGVVPGLSPMSVLRKLAARGTTVLCLYVEDERRIWYDHVWSRLCHRRITRKNLEIGLLPGRDHSLYTASTRDAAVQAMTSFLFRKVVPPAGPDRSILEHQGSV